MNKVNNNKMSLNNLTYQTINFEKGLTHQRTKSNNVEKIDSVKLKHEFKNSKL